MRSIMNMLHHGEGKKEKAAKKQAAVDQTELNQTDVNQIDLTTPVSGTTVPGATDFRDAEVTVAPNVAAHVGTGAGLDKTNVVGVPGAERTIAEMEFQGAEIASTSKTMEVSHVQEGVVPGQFIAMETEIVTIPKTEMRMETIEVPEVHMETQTAQMPVTVTKQVPKTVKGVEMRPETITREEVVVEHKTIDIPTTEMRRVTVDKPAIEKFDVTVARPDEYLKEIIVVRPEVVVERVMMERPVTVTRKYKQLRPEIITKKVLAHQPRQVAQPVRIMQPELRQTIMAIQVPQSATKQVVYQKPVTVVCPAEGEGLIRHHRNESISSSSSSSASDTGVDTKKDLATTPVGVPFTEVLEQKKEFTVTSLVEQPVELRETWMIPKDITKFSYELEPVEVEVTETIMREEEVEYIETVLETVEVDVEVTVMKEVMEKWPVNKQHKEVITTTDVVMQPTETLVAQLTTRPEVIDVPHKHTVTEQIEKAVPVTREVMVDQPTTEMREVQVQRPVEGTKTIQVEHPYITHERVRMDVPTTVQRDVHVQNVRDIMQEVTEETAYHTDKHLTYRTVQPGVHAVAVPKDSIVKAGTKHAHVGIAEIERARVEAEVQSAQAKFATASELQTVNQSALEKTSFEKTEYKAMTGDAAFATAMPATAGKHTAYDTVGNAVFAMSAEEAAYANSAINNAGQTCVSACDANVNLTREEQHVHHKGLTKKQGSSSSSSSSAERGNVADSQVIKGTTATSGTDILHSNKRVIYSSANQQDGPPQDVMLDPTTGRPILDPTGKPLMQPPGSRGVVDPATGRQYMSQAEMIDARARQQGSV